MTLDGKTYVALFVEFKWTCPQDSLYSALEASTGEKPRQPPMYITPGGRDSRIPADAVSSMWSEAVCQIMWYLYTGWINFSTQHGVAIFNEFFVRVSVIQVIELGSDNGGSDMKGSDDKGTDDKGVKKSPKNESSNIELVFAVEVHPSVSLSNDSAGPSSIESAGLRIDSPSPARPAMPFVDFLKGTDNRDMWEHPPNSLVSHSVAGVRQVDQEAMARLSAQIHYGFFLAATATPSSIKQVPCAPRPESWTSAHVRMNAAGAAEAALTKQEVGERRHRKASGRERQLQMKLEQSKLEPLYESEAQSELEPQAQELELEINNAIAGLHLDLEPVSGPGAGSGVSAQSESESRSEPELESDSESDSEPEDPSDPDYKQPRRRRDKEDEDPPDPAARRETRGAARSRALATGPTTTNPSSRHNSSGDTSHSSGQTSQQDCQENTSPVCDENFDDSQHSASQAAFDDDDLQMGDSCGGPAEDDARKYLLASNVSVLLLHPSEMDALIHHMHGGSVRAPTADLHDWFLSVDPFSPPVSSTPPSSIVSTPPQIYQDFAEVHVGSDHVQPEDDFSPVSKLGNRLNFSTTTYTHAF